MQFHGGMGYAEEMWPARYYRDGRLTSIGGGADEVMLRVIAMMEGMGRSKSFFSLGRRWWGSHDGSLTRGLPESPLAPRPTFA